MTTYLNTGISNHRSHHFDDGKPESERSARRLEEQWRLFGSLSEEDGRKTLTLLDIGMQYAELGNNARALKTFEQCRSIARNHNDTTTECRALEAIGVICSRMHDYAGALRAYFSCLRIQNLREDSGVGATWMEIGNVYRRMGNNDQATRCFNRSIDHSQRNNESHLELLAMMNLATVLTRKGEWEQALAYLHDALSTFRALGDRRNITEALTAIGNVHEAMGDLDQAFEYQSLALASEHDAPELRGSLHFRIGCLFRSRMQFAEAGEAFIAALELAQTLGDLQLQYQIHEEMALLFEREGNLMEALAHYKRFAVIREEYISQARERMVAELQLLFDVELAEREREIFRLEAETLRQTVRKKNRELTNMALILVQKSEFLDELKRQLADVLESSSESGIAARPILDEISSSREVEGGWRIFEQQFEEVHRDFMRRLAERFPTLTPMELKICALTRIDMATKDIAKLLFLSIRSIQNHRYRIRKKLGVEQEINLVSYLTGI